MQRLVRARLRKAVRGAAIEVIDIWKAGRCLLALRQDAYCAKSVTVFGGTVVRPKFQSRL